jgi:hypothetical protein
VSREVESLTMTLRKECRPPPPTPGARCEPLLNSQMRSCENFSFSTRSVQELYWVHHTPCCAEQ